jgi:hypothetical protein
VLVHAELWISNRCCCKPLQTSQGEQTVAGGHSLEKVLVQGPSCARRRSCGFLGTAITRRRKARTCGSAVTRLERRRCWVTRRTPGPVADRAGPTFHPRSPGNHADLGRARLRSARALDAREPVSEEGTQEFRLLVG